MSYAQGTMYNVRELTLVQCKVYTLYNMYIKGTDLEKGEEDFSDLVYSCTM